MNGVNAVAKCESLQMLMVGSTLSLSFLWVSHQTAFTDPAIHSPHSLWTLIHSFMAFTLLFLPSFLRFTLHFILWPFSDPSSSSSFFSSSSSSVSNATTTHLFVLSLNAAFDFCTMPHFFLFLLTLFLFLLSLRKSLFSFFFNSSLICLTITHVGGCGVLRGPIHVLGTSVSAKLTFSIALLFKVHWLLINFPFFRV